MQTFSNFGIDFFTENRVLQFWSKSFKRHITIRKQFFNLRDFQKWFISQLHLLFTYLNAYIIFIKLLFKQ